MKIKIKDATTRLCTQDIKLAKLVIDYINDSTVDYSLDDVEAVDDDQGVTTNEIKYEMLPPIKAPKKNRKIKKSKRNKNLWNKKETDFLFANMDKKPRVLQMCDELKHRTVSSVSNRKWAIKAKRLNLLDDYTRSLIN